jgi:DNA-directed RNA polymerase specialized sigma subunit
MTAKEYREQSWSLDDEIKCKIEQLDVLNTLAKKTTTTLSGMPHAAGHEGSKLEDIIVKIVGLQEEINADIDRLVDLKKEIGQKIALIANPDLRLLLEERYLCKRTWSKISAEMNVANSHVYRLHGAALKAFEEIFES